jgi:pimeloyl-ACP methyl ester carboxylesterase
MLDMLQHSVTPTAGAPPLPLVMLPGTLCDARLYAPVLEHLGRRAHIPDLAGATTSADLAAAMLLHLPERFALCGFSLGAIVALEIAAQRPERVERLALIGCNPGPLPPVAAQARQELKQREFVASSFDRSDPRIRQLIDDMAHNTEPSVYQQQTEITVSRIDSRPRLGRLAMPVLILCGSEDQICSPALSIEMARAIPQARLSLIEGAGHYVTLERPEAVAAEIAAWLAAPVNTLH